MAKKKAKTSKAVARRSNTTKTAKRPKATKKTTANKPPTKTEIYTNIADMTGMTRKQVASVFEALGQVAQKNLGKRGPQVFTVPGFAKFRVVRKPATKARKGINPFTGQEMMFKAKPARNIVKATPLKIVKDWAA